MFQIVVFSKRPTGVFETCSTSLQNSRPRNAAARLMTTNSLEVHLALVQNAVSMDDLGFGFILQPLTSVTSAPEKSSDGNKSKSCTTRWFELHKSSNY